MVANAFAQVSYRVLPQGSDALLNSYLMAQADKAYVERLVRLNKALSSKKELKKYQKNISFGAFSYEGNSKARTVGVINFDSYKIEKLIIDSRITANLYLPKKKGRHSAILLLCGHEIQGKSAESYQKTASLLAQNDFVVLVPDPIGQGELIQLLDSTGKPLTPRATTEHTLLNQGAVLVDYNVALDQFYHNSITLSYLASRPEVDDKRIGCVGNSGGGTQATYLSAFEDRIKAVACCSFFTKRERMLHTIGPDDGCQILADEIKSHYEIVDFYIKQAPHPTLILAGTKDFIDYQGVQEAFAELKQAYTLLGKPDNAQLFVVEDGHGISKPKREATVRFFKTYFMKDSSVVIEPELTVLSDSILRCTKSGQLYVSQKSNPFQKKTLKYAVKKQKQRKSKTDKSKGLESDIRNLLSIPSELPAISVRETEHIKLKEATLNKLIISRKGEPDMPALLFLPEKINPQAAVYILLNDSGMAASLQTNKINELIEQGSVVMLVDPRGIGETKDVPEKNNKKFYSEDYRNAALSVMLGKPLLGQRVIDIFSMIDALTAQPELKNKKIICLSEGNIGVAAIHACYLDARIVEVRTNNCIESWMDMLLEPTAKNRMSLVVPKALIYYDIPDIKK